MRKALLSFFCLPGLCCLAFSPAYAGGKNLPKTVGKAVAGSPAFQEALRHAQAIRSGSLKRLENSLKTLDAKASTAPSYNQPSQPPQKVPAKKPQQWLSELETFVAQNNRLPNHSDAERQLALALSNLSWRLPPDHPVALRLRQLQEQFPSRKKIPAEQWLAKLEIFIEQNGRFPLMANPQEREILLGATRTLARLSPSDPIALRLRQLRTQYPHHPRGNTPQEWLSELETFVAQNNRLPRPVSDPPERDLYRAINNVLRRLPAQDPVALRILELKARYSQPAHP